MQNTHILEAQGTLKFHQAASEQNTKSFKYSTKTRTSSLTYNLQQPRIYIGKQHYALYRLNTKGFKYNTHTTQTRTHLFFIYNNQRYICTLQLLYALYIQNTKHFKHNTDTTQTRISFCHVQQPRAHMLVYKYTHSKSRMLYLNAIQST